MKIRTASAATVLLMASLAVTGCEVHGIGPQAEGSFERTLQVAAPADIDVQTGAGGIQVRTGDGSTVRIFARIRAGGSLFGGSDPQDKIRRLEKDPPIEQTGSVIRIGRIGDPDLRRNISISYELVVPSETRLRASTGSGSQEIDGVRGPVTAHTGSGGISLANIGGEVRAQTGSGSIKLDMVKGRVNAATGSGGIHGSAIAGAIDAETGSGSIKMEQTAPGNVNVSTGSGGIEVSGMKGGLRARSGSGTIAVEGEPTGAWDVDVGSGNLRVRLPPAAAFDVHARSGSGGVTIDHPLSAEGVQSNKEKRGKVRGGGPMLNLRTASGSIHVQ